MKFDFKKFDFKKFKFKREEEKEEEEKLIDSDLTRESIRILNTKNYYRGIIVGLGALIVVLLIVIVVLILRPRKNTGFVVEVNPLTGEQKVIKNAVKELSSFTAPEYLMINTVKSYITSLRSVSTDSGVNRDNVRKVFAFTTGKASATIKEFYAENKPLERSKRERVEVEIYNAMPINSASSLKFQVDWNEIRRSVSTGEIIEEKNYRADVDMKQYKATKSTSEYNPLGLYVVSINISEIYDGFRRSSSR